MKHLKEIVCVCLTCIIFIISGQEIQASSLDNKETENLSTAEKLEQIIPNVLAVELIYRDDEEMVHVLHTGSGFLIGEGEDAPQYMITGQKVTSLREEERELLQSADIKENNLAIRVVVKQDVTIEASVVTDSEEMGFALLSLSQPLYDRGYMVLNNTFAEFESPMEIYSIGVANQEMRDGTAQISRGNLIKTEEKNGVNVWFHDSYRNEGYIGGPLVDAEGNVLGINQSYIREETLQATSIDEILPVLDALGVGYRTTAMEIDEQQEKEQRLQNAMEVVTAVREPVIGNTSDSDSKLVPTLIICGCVLLVIGVVILIVLIVTKDKRAEKKRIKKEELTVTQAAPIFERQKVSEGEAALIRVKTGQREVIAQERFLIGKERGRVDFYIGDNSAVSRMHACIVKKADSYYLTEQHATNGTFLNDEIVYSGEEKLIKSGDIIRLADEEFEFIWGKGRT